MFRCCWKACLLAMILGFSSVQGSPECAQLQHTLEELIQATQESTTVPDPDALINVYKLLIESIKDNSLLTEECRDLIPHYSSELRRIKAVNKRINDQRMASSLFSSSNTDDKPTDPNKGKYGNQDDKDEKDECKKLIKIYEQVIQLWQTKHKERPDAKQAIDNIERLMESFVGARQEECKKNLPAAENTLRNLQENEPTSGKAKSGVPSKELLIAMLTSLVIAIAM